MNPYKLANILCAKLKGSQKMQKLIFLAIFICSQKNPIKHIYIYNVYIYCLKNNDKFTT